MKDIRGYDPQSLITGSEVERGLTYDNSERRFESIQVERAIKQTGLISELTLLAPRVPIQNVGFAKDFFYYADGQYKGLVPKRNHKAAQYQGD